MAWDALQGKFSKKDVRQEKDSIWDDRAQLGAGVGGVGSSAAPTAAPLAPYGGTAGSSEGPASSRFVNYGRLYGLNEDKAKQMAHGVYKGAEGKAEAAKGSLAAAQSQFKDKVSAGTARGPIGGAHGTRVTNWNPPVSQEAQEDTGAYGGTSSHVTAEFGPQMTPAKRLKSDGTGRVVVIDDSQLEAENEQRLRESAQTRNAVANAKLAAGRYGSLFGDQPMQYNHAPVVTPEDKAGLADYHHTVSPGQANTAATQEYSGPDSLKDSMGDEAYAQLGEQFRDAGEDLAGTADAGGLAELLGYTGVEGSGGAALDAGLTQTAGQSNFKKLRERYAGLNKLLPTAQSDSLADVGRADAASESAAGEWGSMMDDFTEATKPEGESPKSPEEKQKDTAKEMRDWAYFAAGGATDTADAYAKEIGGALTLSQKSAYQTLSDMGYSNDVIMAAWKKWRETSAQWPTAQQLAQLILAGGL